MRDEPPIPSASSSGNPPLSRDSIHPTTPDGNSPGSAGPSRDASLKSPATDVAAAGTARFQGFRWRAVTAVAIYAILLATPSFLGRTHAILPGTSVWELQTIDGLADWGAQVALHAFGELLRFIPLGILVVWAVSRRGRSAGVFSHCSAASAVGLPLTWLVVSMEVGGLPDAGRLILPLLGCGVGCWIGAGAARGLIGLVWLVPQLGVAGLLVAGAGLWFVDTALEAEPLPFEPPAVTSAEKRRLVSMIRHGQTVEKDSVLLGKLRFSEHDVNVLAAWGLTLEDAGRKARFEFDADRVIGAASVRVPAPGTERSYLNVRFRGRFAVVRGRLFLEMQTLQLGRVELPAIVTGLLAGRIESLLMGDKNIAEIVEAIQSAQVENETVEIVYVKNEVDVRVLPKLVGGLGQKPDVLEATREHVRHLVEVGRDLPSGRARFSALLQTAFRHAAERSGPGNAALENRAAIYAMAILWGHPHVETLIGPAMDAELRARARNGIGGVSIRGRSDWTQHFLVSSALALLSSEVFSDAVGLLKEELDAGRGGSGFSFGDLLADRAGTQFALAATRDEAAARRMQEFLSGPFHLDDVFPPAADLPEGIPDARLQSQYGGVNGAGYREVVEEIERRLASCRALQ